MEPTRELFLSTAEVAAMIRTPEATLRYWRSIGTGPRSFRMGAKRVLYKLSDVEAWVAEQYETTSTSTKTAV